MQIMINNLYWPLLVIPARRDFVVNPSTASRFAADLFHGITSALEPIADPSTNCNISVAHCGPPVAIRGWKISVKDVHFPKL
jgi:hypothetical protein